MSSFPDSKGEPSLQKILEAQETKLKLKAIGSIVQDGEGGNHDSLTSTIVKGAIDDRNRQVDQYIEHEKAQREEILELKKEGQITQNQFMQSFMDRIKDQEEHLEEKRLAAMGDGGKPDDFEAYKKIKSLLTETINELGLKPAGSTAPVADRSLDVKLQEMQFDHDFKMKELEARQKEVDRKWDADMLKWKQEFEFKKEEFKESKNFKESAFGDLKDIVSSLGGAVTHEREEIEAAAGDTEIHRRPVERVAADPGETLTPTVAGFRCEKCGGLVQVPEDYPEKITCPKDGCGMIYRLKKPALAGVKL